MRSSDILKHAVGTKFAVVRINGYARQEEVRNKRVRRQHTETVTLVSHDYYELNDYLHREADTSRFSRAQAGERGGKGFLAMSAEGTYQVVKPSRFLDTAEQMESIWNQAEEEDRKRQEHADKLRSARDGVVEHIRELNATKQKSLAQSIQELLGVEAVGRSSIYLSVDGKWQDEESDNPRYEAWSTGTVQLSVGDFQRLLEKVYEAQDN